MFTLKNIVLSAAVALSMSTVAMAAQNPTSQLEKESYAMGAFLGHTISGTIAEQKKLGADIDLPFVFRGFEDAVQNKSDAIMTSDEVLKVVNERAETLSKLKADLLKKIAAANAEKAKAFLAENAKKKGVVTTESGLQYEVLKEGVKGDSPRTEDVVTIDYVAKFMDGTVFESTYDANEPNRVVVMGVIDGLSEALKMMTTGARWRVTIPANLAWGEDGVDGKIPPESVVIFEVQLEKVEKVGAHSNFGNANLNGMVSPH